MTSLLRAESLAIGYGARGSSQRIVARSLDLSLERGELVCLLGANGTGKSTLLRTLAGLQKPLSGCVRLEGESIESMPPKVLARRVAVVLTDRVRPGALRVRALVALGRLPFTGWLGRLGPEDLPVVQRALEHAGAADLAERSFEELSDGEKQKVLIARALAQEPRILFLDEPTVFLDLAHRVEILGRLRSLAGKGRCGALAVTHDLDGALRNADRLWILFPDGSLRHGAPEDLVLDGSLEQAFLGPSLSFSYESGHFYMRAPEGLDIVLEGRGLARRWTTRALVRAGFRVRENGGPSLPRVTVSEENGVRAWRLELDGHRSSSATIHDLLGELKTLVASPNRS